MSSKRRTKRIRLFLLVVASTVLLACDDRRGGDVETFADVTGTVVSLEPSRRQIVVAHEDIPGLMEAMTMPFEVEDPAALARIAEGDRIRFTLRRIDGQLRVREIERAPGGGPPAANASPAP
jgi:Cu/Ag efflux protein CusF